MDAATKGKHLIANCHPRCSLSERAIGHGPAEVLRGWREEGMGSERMANRATDLLKRPVLPGTMARHLKHYREVVPEAGTGDFMAPVGQKAGDLDILDAIIQQGARNAHNWKPSIKDTLEAMKLKMQITGNSAFDDMLAAMEAGLRLSEGASEDDLDDVEAPEAISDEIEREIDDDEADLDDPAL